MKKQKILKSDWGIACKIGEIIYLNKNLYKYPKLKKAILAHEKEHSNSYQIKDLLIDLRGKHLQKVKKEYYLFILRYPKSLITFFPVWKFGNAFVVDPIMTLLWLVCFWFLWFLNILK